MVTRLSLILTKHFYQTVVVNKGLQKRENKRQVISIGLFS